MKIKYFLLSLLMLFFPAGVFGASLSIEPRGLLPSLGDTAIFDVYLNTDDQTINAVDGSILLDDKNILFFQNTFVAGSIFSFWPNKPVFNNRNRTVSFVGGVPGGVKTSHGLLFSLSFSTKDAGTATFIPQKTIVYLNDEEATPVIATGQNLSFSVAETGKTEMRNDLQALIVSDKTPPQPFVVTLNQEPSLFNGQKFISFATIDNETGVAYYEVKEGQLPPERAEIQYVLQDQNIQNNVVVTAYDLAGNKREAILQLTAPVSYFRIFVSVLAVIAVLLLVAVSYRVIKKKHKNINN